MSSEWLQTTLGVICSTQKGSIQTGPFGSQLHVSDYKEIGIPVIMPTNIGEGIIMEQGIARIDSKDADRLSQHKLQIGDIVFSRRGDVTRNALINNYQKNWLCGTGCLKVRLGNQSEANAQFISYYLRLPEIKEWLVRHAVGATMLNLNTGILSAVPVSLPPIRQQLEIASILSALDDKIALNRKTNATLEAIAQALFKSWFVDFDPVRAKAEGREPEGMDETTAALFPNEFVESEVGLIPREWIVCSFIDTVKVIGGGTPKTTVSEFWNGNIPWFSVVDAPQETDVFVLDTEKHISTTGLRNSSTCLLDEGITIISARGTVGKVALTGISMAMNQSCYGLQGFGSYYTYYSTGQLVSTMQQRSHGSVFSTITRDTLGGLKVAKSPKQLIQAYEDRVESLMLKIKSQLRESKTLAAIRNAILPKLISGQLRIPEAEEVIKSIL